MKRIVAYILLDIIRNKTVLLYATLLTLFSWGIFFLEDNGSKGILTLLSIVLLIVPLMAMLFTTIYIYNSYALIQLLVVQPIHRSTIWMGLWLGVSISLILAYGISLGVVLFLMTTWDIALVMLIGGILLTMIFVSLAFTVIVLSRDKTKGMGFCILAWIYFAILFDGIILFLSFQLSEYPIEKGIVVMSALSPIDLVRILILLQLDKAQMMGYTGAIFKQFFGSSEGLALSFFLLACWSIVPFLFSLKKFKTKNL